MGRVEEVRKEVRAAEYDDIVDNLEYLGSPYDKMDIDTKKEHALPLFYKVLKVIPDFTRVTLVCDD